MNTRFHAIGLSLLALFSSSGVCAAQSAPPNDDCATPTILAGPAFYPLNTSLATAGAQGQLEPLCLFVASTAIARDVWYTYTPSTSGTVRVSTCGLLPVPPSVTSDSKIAVYAASGCPVDGSAIACNDDAGNACPASFLNTIVEFTATCGATYTIQIGQYAGSTSSNSMLGQFSVSESGGTPCNGPFFPFCAGDGSSGACPCSNESVVGAGQGCRNSSGNGARLGATGIPSVSADTVTLNLTNLPIPPTIPSTVLFFQGTAQTSAPFADGRVCVGGSMVRLAIKAFGGSTSSYPATGDLSVSVKGLLPVGGGARHYQAWYRDVALPCGTRSNLTNGLTIPWTL